MNRVILTYYQVLEHIPSQSDIADLFRLSCSHYTTNPSHFSSENNDIFNLIIKSTITHARFSDDQSHKMTIIVLELLNHPLCRTNRFSHCINSLLKMLYTLTD